MFQFVSSALPAAAVSILLGSAVALAGGPQQQLSGRHQARLLEKFGDQGIDADQDGMLTHAEVRAFFEANPDLKPGKVGHRGGRHMGPGGRVMQLLRSLEQLDSGQIPEGIVQRQPKLDTNGDGQLSAEEWTGHVEKKRARLVSRLLRMEPSIDSDGDGQVSAAELSAFSAQRKEAVRATVLANHPEADTDGDGVLSEAEFEAFNTQLQAERAQRILERHPEADTNGDGVLSQSELDSFRDSRPGWRGRGGRDMHRPHGRPAWDDDGPMSEDAPIE